MNEDTLGAQSVAMAHVIIAAGVVPGVDTCQCQECWLVATKLAEAGYLKHVQDRWWERFELNAFGDLQPVTFEVFGRGGAS